MAADEAGVEAANGQMVGFYYQSTGGGTLSVDECSGHMDSFGWTSNWRGEDDADILWNAECNGDYLFPGTPDAFVIETATMTLNQSSFNFAADAQSYNK